MRCRGTMLRCTARGDTLHFISLIDGAKGFVHDPGIDPIEAARSRVMEMKHLAWDAGATYINLGFPEEFLFDAAILAVGREAAFRHGMRALRTKGRLEMFSPVPGDTPVDLFDVHMRELEIAGAVSDRECMDDALAALDDVSCTGMISMAADSLLSTTRTPFDAAARDRSETMKVVFVFGNEMGLSGREDMPP